MNSNSSKGSRAQAPDDTAQAPEDDTAQAPEDNPAQAPPESPDFDNPFHKIARSLGYLATMQATLADMIRDQQRDLIDALPYKPLPREVGS